MFGLFLYTTLKYIDFSQTNQYDIGCWRGAAFKEVVLGFWNLTCSLIMSDQVTCAQTQNANSISVSKIFYYYSNRRYWCLPNQLVNHILQWLLFEKILWENESLKFQKVQTLNLIEMNMNQNEIPVLMWKLSTTLNCCEMTCRLNCWIVLTGWHPTIQGGFFCPNSCHSLWQFSPLLEQLLV